MKFLFLFVSITLSGMAGSQLYAQESITFGPHETRLQGEIPYSVIGKYKAQFRVFKGRITFDKWRIRSVYLKIGVKSIASNCLWCDKIARSKRLLNAARYPDIIFKGDKVSHDENGFKIRGILDMHGIKKVMIFPFHVDFVNDHKNKTKLMMLEGSWVINRKDFNIVWNKYLDHGGVLVGDNFTVNWRIKAEISHDPV